MPVFLVRGNYTGEGLKGLMKDGGTGRRDAVAKAVASLGGKMLSIYFALGDTDVYVIAELPDAIAASAVALAAGASGAVSINTCQLLTPEDVDMAIAKTVTYRSPGA
jgi:uncharacterized protein with GYD domain